MSGIKDCSATPNAAHKIKPVISGFLWTGSLLHFVPWAKTPGSVPEVGQYLQRVSGNADGWFLGDDRRA